MNCCVRTRVQRICWSHLTSLSSDTGPRSACRSFHGLQTQRGICPFWTAVALQKASAKAWQNISLLISSPPASCTSLDKKCVGLCQRGSRVFAVACCFFLLLVCLLLAGNLRPEAVILFSLKTESNPLVSSFTGSVLFF